MGRQLKYHEQRLLRKVDFLNWKSDGGHREAQVMRSYHVQNRDDYHKYNKICGAIRHLAYKMAQLPPQDPIRLKYEEALLEKLEKMGIFGIEKPKVSDLEKVTVAAFCRRRLPVVMTRLHMMPSIPEATKMIEQGQVRVGPELVTDPAMLVTRDMEDYVTWVDSSKIRRRIAEYRDHVDDYDLL